MDLISDPTPNVTVDSLNIFVPENSMPNLDIMKIHVKAITSQGMTNGLVQLSIAPGKLSINLHHYFVNLLQRSIYKRF